MSPSQEVNCPEIPAKRGLTATSADTKLGSQINFTCTDDNSLIGASQITCLASGNWSAALPVCESKKYLGRSLANGSLDHGFFKGVECGDIPLTSYYNNNPHNQQNSHHQGNWTTPQVSVLSREVGGQAVFSCPAGAIRGPVESICQPSGEWSTPFPTCAGKLSECLLLLTSQPTPARCNNQPTNLQVQSSSIVVRPTCASCISVCVPQQNQSPWVSKCGPID